MNLTSAFRLESVPCLAFAGSGGKTTAIFRLARELAGASSPDGPAPRVLVSTTTHLAASQLSLADSHRTAAGPEDLARLEQDFPAGVVLVTGPPAPDEANRISGIGGGLLEGLFALAQARRLPFLLEVDGSRMRPLKAPSGHEPAMPPFASHVVVVAGLSGLGKPLHPDWVHRPERFAALSGLEMGQPVTPQALARVLAHPAGGLKDIPPGARRIALLNQADTVELRSLARPLAQMLLPAFDAAVLAALEPGDGRARHAQRDDAGPVFSVHKPVFSVHEPVFSVHEPAAAIILAAGAASRYGQPKQLLPWQGEPLVRGIARKALQAGLSPVIAVTGAYAGQVQAALQGLELRVVHNPDWSEGQSTSLRAGLAQLPENTASALFLLADQPQIPVELIRALVNRHAETLSPLVAPKVGGRRANPVLFDRVTFPALARLEGDMGGRGLFAEPDRYPIAWLPWEDESLLLDVDTPQDYRSLLDRMT